MNSNPKPVASTRLYWTLAITVLALSTAWVWISRVPEAAVSQRLPSPREGFPAPDLTLSDLNGSKVSLADYQGQVVIVNLWASWCAPCQAEMPVLQTLYEANVARGLVVLAVNSTYQDDLNSALTFVESRGLTFPVLLDVDGSVSRRYLLQALPSTFIIDRVGTIRAVLIGGPVSEAVLQSKLEPLLVEP